MIMDWKCVTWSEISLPCKFTISYFTKLFDHTHNTPICLKSTWTEMDQKILLPSDKNVCSKTVLTSLFFLQLILAHIKQLNRLSGQWDLWYQDMTSCPQCVHSLCLKRQTGTCSWNKIHGQILLFWEKSSNYNSKLPKDHNEEYYYWLN